MTTQARYHRDTGREFLARARVYLAEDDLLQASEKGWGAAAQMVKAVAESRGWPHSVHRDLWRTINRLADETSDEDIRIMFGLAGELHTNFHEGWLDRETVDAYLSRVEQLTGKLSALAA